MTRLSESLDALGCGREAESIDTQLCTLILEKFEFGDVRGSLGDGGVLYRKKETSVVSQRGCTLHTVVWVCQGLKAPQKMVLRIDSSACEQQTT